MLSQSTIDRINQQIQEELRIVEHPFKSHQEKTEAIERAAALKAILDIPKEEEKKEQTIREHAEDWMEMLRRRA
jgi:vacuolar-type H+-ATPase subunit F/Vma7